MLKIITKKAIKLASLSPGIYKHSAIFFSGKQILSTATNTQEITDHAETNALKKLTKDQLKVSKD